MDNFIGREGRKLEEKFTNERRTVLRRFPTLFILLTAFGGVSLFHGFERLVDTIPFLYERPLLLIVIGFAILAGTGALYKQLSKQGNGLR